MAQSKKIGRSKRNPSTVAYKTANRKGINKARHVKQAVAKAGKVIKTPHGTARANRRNDQMFFFFGD